MIAGHESPVRRVARGVAAGAIAGVFASFAMNRFQAATAPLLKKAEGDKAQSGDKPEPSTQKAADSICRLVFGRDVPDIDKRNAGRAVHYAAGAAIGIGYGIAAEFAPRTTAGFGSALGLVTAAVLDDTIVPLAGWGEPVWKGDAAGNTYSHVSHLVFGWSAELARRAVARVLGGA